MNLIVTISGTFSEELDDGDIDDLREDLEDTVRQDYGAQGVSVEVVRA